MRAIRSNHLGLEGGEFLSQLGDLLLCNPSAGAEYLELLLLLLQPPLALHDLALLLLQFPF